MHPVAAHLRALAVLAAFSATMLLGMPGMDSFGASALRSADARAKARARPLGWASIAMADFNRSVRLPIVAYVEPIQRPLRLAQSWSLYGGGPGKVKRLEIEVDGVLRHRSKDPDHDWLAHTLSYRRIRPIVAAICGKRSKSTEEMIAFIGKRAERDFPGAAELEVRCTSSNWPGTNPKPIVGYHARAPLWQVEL